MIGLGSDNKSLQAPPSNWWKRENVDWGEVADEPDDADHQGHPVHNFPEYSEIMQKMKCLAYWSITSIKCKLQDSWITRSSWLNCALRDDEAVYCFSIGHYYEAVAVSNWWYWVSRGHSCLYILYKVEIWSWTGVTDALRTDSLTTLKDRATQLLIKYKSGPLVTQFG